MSCFVLQRIGFTTPPFYCDLEKENIYSIQNVTQNHIIVCHFILYLCKQARGILLKIGIIHVLY